MFVIEEERLLRYEPGGEAKTVIPPGVKGVGKGAFEGSDVRCVVFSNEIRTIGERVFAGCEALEEVVLNEGLRRFSEYCFEGCSSLRRVAMPDTVASLRGGVFSGCTALEEVVLSAGLQRNIEEYTFAGCRALRRIVIPASIQKIQFRAFLDCFSLETVVFENPDVQLEAGAFTGCTALDEQTRQFIEAHTHCDHAVDIRSSASGAAGRLSNFTARTFVFDGVECGSIEGVLQGMKCPDAARQREICALAGGWARSAGREYDWRPEQTLYWQGKTFARLSRAYGEQIDRLYDAVFDQDESFREDLAQLRGRVIDHRMGHSDPAQTVLTRREFVGQLNRQLSKLDQRIDLKEE